MEVALGLVEAVVSRLLAHQREHALSDVQMAGRIGVDPTHWLRVRHGRHGAGVQIVDGAARAFPDLVKEAMTAVGDASAAPAASQS